MIKNRYNLKSINQLSSIKKQIAMKKFTLSFLSGGFSRALHIFRSLALGLMALIGIHLSATGQTCTPPSGVQFSIDSITPCYQAENEYSVEVWVDNFDNVDTLSLVIDFDGSTWTLDDVDINSAFLIANNGTGTLSSVTSEGSVVFTWDCSGDPRGSVNSGDSTLVATLTFSIKNFPNNSEDSYATALTYDAATYVGYCENGAGGFYEYTAATLIPGYIKASKETLDITLDYDTIACDANYTTVTVTSPSAADGYTFSFNGVSNTKFSSSNTSTAEEGDHVVYVKDENGCLTSKDYTVIKESAIFTFDTEVEDETCMNEGEITIVPTNSASSYTYYCVDTADFDSTNMAVSNYSAYSASDPDFELSAGVYYTNIANGCGEGDWVLDTIEAGSTFNVEGGVTDSVDVCSNAGEYTVVIIDSLTDSTTFSIKVYDVDNGGTLVSAYSILDTTPTADSENDTIVIGDIAAGNYKIEVSDGTVCTFTDNFEIEEGDEITFTYKYSDIACSDTSGMFWVTTVDGDSIADIDADEYGLILVGRYTDADGSTVTTYDTITTLNDTIDSLMPGIYDAYLYVVGTDYSCKYSKLDIVLFDRGTIEFTANDTLINCGENAIIWVTDIERNCATCTDDAVYEARLYDVTNDAVYEDWVTIDSVDAMTTSIFSYLDVSDTVTYRVDVKDTKNDEQCISSRYVTFIEADSFYCIVDSIYTPSCECGNDGSVKLTMVNGTAPYSYSINGSEWTTGDAFNLKENQDYLIAVKDANGCEWSDSITEPDIDPFLIVVDTVAQAECDGENAYIYIDTVSTTHWTSGFSYYRSKTKIELASGNCSDPDDVRDVATEITNSSSDLTTKGTAFKEGTGKWYIYAIDKYGCVAMDSVVIDTIDPMEVTITLDSAQCYDSWTAGLTITVTEGTGNPDSVFYYRWSNNKDVLVNDPAGTYHEWRSMGWNETDSVPYYTATASMTSGTYWIEVKDACDSYYEKVTIGGWDELDVTAALVENSKCFSSDDGVISVTSATGGAVGNVADASYTYTLLKDTASIYYVGGGIVEYIPTGGYEVYGTYDEVTDTTFEGLEPGNYVVLVNDGYCNPDTSNVIFVTAPNAITFTTEIQHVTCADANDGTVLLRMKGGLAGTYGYYYKDGSYYLSDSVMNDEAHYYVTVNNLTDGTTATRTVDNDIDTLIFTTDGGTIAIEVTDENGVCSAKDTIHVFEPEPWSFEAIKTYPSNCDTADGKIQLIVHGGFVDTLLASPNNGGDQICPLDLYYISGVDTVTVADVSITDKIFSGDTILLTDSAELGACYQVFVKNDSTTLARLGTYVIGNNWIPFILNGDQCEGDTTICFDNFDPFDVDFTTECAKCYGEDNGSITLTSITGGFSGKYRLQFVPTDSAYVDAPADSSVWWPSDSTWISGVDSVNTVTYDSLGAGTYKLYIIDSLGYTVEKCCNPFAFSICEPEELVIDSVVRIQNNGCEGETTGAFKIYASGGTPEYKYYYTRQDIDADTFNFPGVPDESLFQDSAVFDSMASGAYVGWVMDANGCIVGCDLDDDGLPRDGQRVVIYDGEAIVYDSVSIDGAGCNYEPVTVTYYNVTGAAADSITLELIGGQLTEDGDTVDVDLKYTKAYVEGNDIVFTKVPVGTYETYLTTEGSCPWADTLEIEPGDFKVTYTLNEGGACYGDSKLYFTMKATGGVAPYTYAVFDADGNELRAAMSVADVNFNDLDYSTDIIIEAYDANGCTAHDSIKLSELQPVEVEIANITCYADTLGSVRVSATGTSGRYYYAYWDEFEGDTQIASGQSDTFSTSIDLINTFHYDPEGTDDVHYEITVYDNEGCQSGIDTITIHTVNDELEINNYTQASNGCTNDVTFDIDGGTKPYDVYVDDEYVTDNDGSVSVTLSLAGGDHTIKVIDAHTRCTVEKEITADYSAVAYDTISAYVGETVEYVFNDDLDTIAFTAVADTTYELDYITSAGCSAALFLTAEVGTQDAPEVTAVSPTDTVENVTPTFVITFAEDIDFNDSVTGYIYVTPADSTGLGSMTIEITADMVSGNTITIDGYSSELDKNTTYVVTVDSGVVTGDDLAWDGTTPTWTFTTGDFATGTKDLEEETLEFKVYPNPFSSYVKIDSEIDLDRVIISNIAGQRVVDVLDVVANSEISTGNLSSGVYVITMIVDGNIVKSERIIKR
jgi:hypothetical protein